MKLTKKLLSMLLVLCMVLSMLPTIALTASAADDTATWTKVTDASTLSSGDVIILACEDKNAYAGAMGTEKYFASADSIADAIEITLGGSAGEWTLTTSEGTIGTSAVKALNTTGSGTTTWTISISGGNATIQSTNSSYGSILYNASNPRFLNYASGQTAIQIYKKTVTAPSYTITAVSSNTDYGTVELSGSTITATPEDGYEVVGYEVTSGTATVTRNGNVFTVAATSDCTVQIIFAALPTYTLTLNENGTTRTSSNYAGADVTLPAPTNETVGDYTFLGWSASATVSDKPADLMVAGYSYTMPAADTTLYAVYAKVSESGAGSSITSLASGTYYLVDTCGGSYYAMSGTGANVDSVDISTAVTENADGTISIDGTNSAVTEAMQYLVTVGTSTTTVQNVSNSSYVGGNSSTSFATSNTNAWTVTASDGRFTFVYDNRCILYRTDYDFRNYATSNRNSSGYGTGYLYLVPATSYSDWTTTPSGTVTPTYTLTYDANTTDTVTGLPGKVTGIAEGTVYTLSGAAPVRYGYDFYGWAASANSDEKITSVTVNSDVTVYAIWLEKDKYTVSYYDSDNGEAIATKEYYDGETIAAADVPTNYQKPKGFTFVGWYNAAYNDPAAPTYTDPVGTTVTQELTFRAVYAAQGEGSGDGSTFILQLKDDPTIFVGAQSGTKDYAAYTNSADTAAIYGIETSDGNEYLYYLDGTTKIYVSNTGDSTSVQFSETLPSGYPWLIEEVDGVTTIQSTATGKRHFAYNNASPRFAAYKGSTNYPYEFIRVSTGDPDYYTTDPVVPNSYTITWMSEGTQFTTTTVREGNTITAPGTNPTKADSGNKYYTFAGWAASEGGAVLTDFGTATEDKTFYAVYTEGTYATVNWVIDGTTETAYYKDGQTPTHATPSKESDGTYSYTFSGWDPTPTAVTAGETYTYTATFTATEITYTATLKLNKTNVRVGKSVTATAQLWLEGVEVTNYTPVLSSDNVTVATIAQDGSITTLAIGTVNFTATYTVGEKTYTATATLIVSETSVGGYTLITQANAPEDFSGEYIIMGRASGAMADLSSYYLFTPTESGIVDGTNSSATVTLDTDSGEGTFYDKNTGTDEPIVMESTLENNFTDSNEIERTVYDRILEIPEGYAYIIELVDDINGYYTIHIKDTDYYLASVSTASSQGNTMVAEFTSSTELDTKFLWKIRWATADDSLATVDGYTPDVLLIESVYGLLHTTPVSRAILFNASANRFRVYGQGAYNQDSTGLASTYDQNYSIYLFGNPNPFKAQIYYGGDQISTADPATVPQGRESIDLTSTLLPDISTYPNWSQVGEPTWSIISQSNSANPMSINASNGTLSFGAAESGDFVIVQVTYQVHDDINGQTYDVSAQAKIVVTAPDVTYTAVIYETASGNDTEVQYTVTAGLASLQLDYYVVNDMTGEDSKTGTVVEGGTPAWNAISTNGYTVTITDGVLDLSQVTGKDIIQVTLDGVTGNDVDASDATYKVYVITTPKLVADTATITDNTTPISIDVLTNDQNLPEDAVIYGLGKTTADIAASSVTENVTIGTFGSVSVVDGKVQYTPSAGVSDGDQVVFYYAVQDTDGTLYYAKVTITVDGLLPDGALVTDSLVIDFGIPVTFKPTANDTGDFANAAVTGLLATTDGTAASPLTLAEGNAVLNADGTVTFTPTKIMTAPAVFYYTVQYKEEVFTGTVQIIPATNVYYEDSLGDEVFSFAPTTAWATIGTTDESAQQRADFVGDISSNVYGYDEAYAGFATYSLGSAHVATVDTNTTLATVDFDFYGTGFDVVSMTGGNTGYLIVAITDPAKPTEVLYRYVVDTYYGFTYSEAGEPVYNDKGEAVYTYEEVGEGNGEYQLVSGLEVPEGAEVWDSLNGVVYYYKYVGDGNGNYAKVPLLQHWIPTVEASQDFYQIPVMKINNLEPDLYHVSIAAYYSKFYDHAEDGSYQFIFDAVRIYDPCGNSEIATDAYKADGENDAHYLNLRDELIKGKESESVDTSESTTESEEPTVSYTASFTVPDGAAAPADISGETITLPAAVEAPASYDAYSYSFLGWATAEADNTASVPTYYAAGAELTLTEDTDFYAVYTYTTGTTTGTSYILVTDESQLTANAKIVIAAADYDYAMGAQNSNNRAGVAIAKNGNTLVTADGLVEFTLVDNGDGTYAFYDGSGYLYAAATGSNHLKTQNSIDENASWTIDVTDGVASVVAKSFTNRNVMQFNPNTANANPLFACYASASQKALALYQKGGIATYYTTVLATAENKPDAYVASLDPSSLTMNIGDIEEVTPSLTNNGEAVADYEVSYSSDNEDAIYAEAGEITARAAGTATVTATFTVGGTVVTTASCYVTVNAATFRATFTGVDEAHLPAAIEGTTIVLPNMGAPSYTVDGVTYTFLGWVEAKVDNASEEPEYETAGTPVTLTADKTYIALYSWSEGGSGSSSEFALYSGALTEGDYVIVYESGAMVAADADNSERIDYANITISNDTVSNPASNIIWHIAPTGDGYYTIYNSANAVYAAGKGTKNEAAVITDVTDYAKWTVSGESTYDFTNLGNSNKGVNATLRKNGTYGFACYANTTGGALSLYKAGTGGAASYYYTTVIEQTVTYTAEILAESTGLAVGGTTDIISALSASDGSTPAYTSVTWTSSNTAAVSIVSDGESCTATAEAVGSSTITVTYVIDGITKKAEVTIVVSAANDGTQPDSYSTTYNSGTRGVTCTSLSGTNADQYYTGSYTYSALSQQTGSTLLGSLRSLTTSNHSTTTSYNNCRDNAYRTDCQEEDQTVVLLYTGYVADQDDFSGSAPGWNREHVWPQSLGGFGTSGAGSDMHHIRPDDVTTNGDRGNKRFGNVSGGTESLGSSLCNNMLGGWYDNSYFEPLDSVKGDVARICLYVYVRYGSTYDECADITNVFRDTDTLFEWMEMDPVDTWEMGRNVVVEGIQGNRNPFIDYPELAWKLFGQEAPDGYATPSGSLLPCTHSNTTSSTVAATCTTAGSVTVTCSDCGETISTETIAATGHINTTSSTVAATCTTAGSVTVTCSDCGETVSTETIAATGHSYTYTINKGEHTATCSLCGDSKTAAHNYVNKVCECGAQTMSIYFQNNWLWTDVCLYYWYEGGTYADAWPGTAMTWYGKNSDPNNNFDIYTMEVPTHATGVIINGIKNDGSGSRDQSPNIESGWYDGICYYMYWVDGSGNQIGFYDISGAIINTSAVSAEVLPYDLSNTAPVRGASTASVETESSAPATRETTTEEGTASGLVFIDGNNAASLEEYEAYGPNNEIYLARNQAVAFNLSFNTAPKTIQIGLKSVEGDDTADKASWFVVSCGSNTRTFKITTATEMYYDITDLVTIGTTEDGTYASAYPIIITKTNGDLGSLTYLKWTSVASNTATKANASTFLEDEDLTDILDKVDEIVGNTDPDETPVPPAVDEDEGPIMPPDEDEGPIMPPDEDNDPVEDETPDDPVEPPVEDETPVADVEKFTDLDKNSWYYEGVAYAVAKGLMNGMSETQFMPDETLTRAMLVTILYRQAGSPAVGDTELAFTDVAENVWYYDAVAWAYENGITTGVTATEFAPDLPVTRQQMVTFLWRAAGEPEAVKGYGDNAPADAATVAAYAAEAMAWAYENEIIKGEDGLLKPENNATRAQIANIFMRYEKSLALASEM